MPNALPCGECAFYDAIAGSKGKDVKMGWCAKRSRYPFKEGPGKVFPPEVQRVAEGQSAKPYIVYKLRTLDFCTFVQKKKK